MDDAAKRMADCSEAAERALIDSAWAQFEALVARHRPHPTETRRSFALPGFRVLREIHRGGQGVVYQAIQESTQRKVAIKVLKEGPFADDSELARFDREVEILSRLNHPHIVSMYDRGLIAGHAYYVMDYIPGRSLDAHVAGAALALRDVLGLFHKVCEAVNAAHLRGVIHRDLKPSNIRIDEEGEPHVLDFGLAKLAQDPNPSAEAMTVTGQFVGSLPWASPEQAEGRSELLDVRTDVYSLGVVLYQLLTASFPYPVSGRMNDVVRNIAHTSPARPSTLVRGIDRDVEIILLKCLAKEPERRYQGAGELARDIQRYLNGEAIEARPATSLYQLRQFARRNRALVISLVAIMVVLAAATTVSVAFALREAAARHQTQAVADFQGQMLSDIDPQAMGLKLRADLLAKSRAAAGRSGHTPEEIDTRVKELEGLVAGIDLTGLALTALDENVFQRALSAIDAQFADQPLIKAQLLQTLASTLRDLGLLEAATQPQKETLEIRRHVLGDEHSDTLTSINFMGDLLLHQGKLAEAEPSIREAMETRRRTLGAEHPATLASMHTLAVLFHNQGKLAEAERLYRQALDRRRRQLGDEHPATLDSMHDLARLLQEQNRLSEAEPYFREALERYRRVLGDEHPRTLTAVNDVGFLLQAQGKLEEAEAYHREALDARRRILGNEHADTLTSVNSVGFVLHARDRLTEAAEYYLEAMETRRRVLGDEHPDTLISINNMGGLLKDQGKLSDAEPLYLEALATRRRVLGEGHPDTIGSVNNMGWLFEAQGKLAEAEPLYRQALETRRRVLGEEHPETLVSIGNLSSLLQTRGRATEAAALLASAEPAARRVFAGSNAVRLGRFLTLLGRERVSAAEFDAAEANLSEAYTILSDAQGATDRHRADVLRCLVELYDARHAAEPEKGHDQQAAEWRARLAEAQTSTRPTE